MLIKYQNIVFKLPKFPELDYLSDEKRNEFIYVLLYYFHQSLPKKDNYINIVEFSKLSLGKREELLKKVYNNVFYNIGDFQSVLKSKKDTQVVSATEYVENV